VAPMMLLVTNQRDLRPGECTGAGHTSVTCSSGRVLHCTAVDAGEPRLAGPASTLVLNDGTVLLPHAAAKPLQRDTNRFSHNAALASIAAMVMISCLD
jgi:hypothetical protein